MPRVKRPHVKFVKGQVWLGVDGQQRVIMDIIDADSVKVAFVDRRRGPEFLVTTMGHRSMREWISRLQAEVVGGGE